MSEALRLARKGRGGTSPNPMVGAVVMRGGRVVGRGFHRRAGEAHAEVVALDDAGGTARGATLFVTLEPCAHRGRTGPCTERILAAGIRRLVAATGDPHPLVSGKGFARLRRAGLTVDVGDGNDEARALNEAYFLRVAEGRPWVDLKMAVTLDGKVADRSGRARWISGDESRRAVHRLRARSGAILVGIGTILADDPRLTVRAAGRGNEPLRVVLDGSLRTPPSARILTDADPSRVRLLCRKSAPAGKARRLEERGARVWRLPARRGGGVALLPALQRLAEEGVNRLLVEGGGEVAGAFVRRRLADRIHLFVAPKALGAGKDLFRGAGALPLARALRFTPERIVRRGTDLEIRLRREEDACSPV